MCVSSEETVYETTCQRVPAGPDLTWHLGGTLGSSWSSADPRPVTRSRAKYTRPSAKVTFRHAEQQVLNEVPARRGRLYDLQPLTHEASEDEVAARD
ncbi:unnamed protein product [Pleuronectes platessa]|uniref:Uncharacterized protein n=1 Tax=Pleuronectes platessa TaxID=8262 RepID=A0A9N7VVV2_PLEPL|nr:unnamed protein product [Pleuronectes platessa]